MIDRRMDLVGQWLIGYAGNRSHRKLFFLKYIKKEMNLGKGRS